MPKENILPEPVADLPLAQRARRSERLKLQIPLFIRARDSQGEPFLELAKTIDISGTGARIACPRSLTPGSLLTITIPAPSLSSSALVPAGMSPIQCKVTRQHEAGDVFLIALEFTNPIE
jgi:PilZ domain